MNAWKDSGLHQLFTAAAAEAMRRHGLSQIALAAKAGVSSQALSSYLRGDRTPPPPTMEKILAACGRELAIVPLGTPPALTDVANTAAAELRLVADRLERTVLAEAAA
jgi:transcriptional regulator with XRE-family HTH domain